MKQFTPILMIFILLGFTSCHTNNESKLISGNQKSSNNLEMQGGSENKTELNLDLEKINVQTGLPDKWFNLGTKEYPLKIDSSVSHSGYSSVLIESIGAKDKETSGGIISNIPVTFTGKMVELRAYMKLQNVSDGPIGLWLHIIGESKVLGTDTMFQKNIMGTVDWTMYSVTLPLPENAEFIIFGALLKGTGKLWVDDFQILIDGEDLTNAKPKEKQVFNADNDNEFDNGSNILFQDLSPLKIEDLVVLGKIWGFLKYYHPAIAKGNYNWDYELFRILPDILNCQNKIERNGVLSQWIINLGSVELSGLKVSDKSKLKLEPDLDWINDSIILGTRLSGQLQAIRNSKRSSTNYYVKIGMGIPIFTHEKQYSNFAVPDSGFRLLCLYRYWNIIQYFFPYRYLIEEDWNEVLKEYIPIFINSTSELVYKLNTLTLITKIHDTHAYIQGDQTLESYKGGRYLPVDLQFIENKLVVTKIFNDSPNKKLELQKGDIILGSSGIDIQEYVNWMLPMTPASNYSTQLRNIARDYFRTNDTAINVSFQRDGLTKSLNIKSYPYVSYDVPEKRPSSGYSNFELITPRIGYLFPVNINTNALAEFMNSVQYTDGLIIDLRCYPDVIFNKLGDYLMPDTTVFVKLTHTSIIDPGLFTFMEKQKLGKYNSNYYKGKVIIIVNEETQSRAEFTAMALRVAPRAIVIGSTTAGADGDVTEFSLPGGIDTRMSGTGVYYPDGSETQRIGILPDIEVKPTIMGIKEGRDELLEKAIELINKK